ncbi:MAG: DUF262 domain-containing protein [Deltaproteobacteria bacterium]|nr:DUF262 domain-containing protein [Deltaproteobacteria bacterium]
MANTLFKNVDYSVSHLISEIESGEIGLPELQRPFVWKKSKVRDLFDSMYQGFPVGYLLLWANSDYVSRSIGAEKKQFDTPRLLVVDGQQRLTSLFAVLKGMPVVDDQFVEKRIQVAFRPSDASFEVANASTQRDPEYIPDITEVWMGDLPRRRFIKRFLTRLQESREITDEEEDRLADAIDRLYEIESYPFTALVLAAEVDEERVAEVFVRVNSAGVSLRQSDFILTLLSVYWDEGRKQLEHFAREAKKPSVSGASPFNHFIQPDPSQMLRVAVGLAFRRGRLKSIYSLLHGRDLDSGKVSEERRKEQFEELKVAQSYVLDLTNWHEFLKCLVRAGFRSSSMISSQTAILYTYLLYLVGRRDFAVPPNQLREIIARWFFMVAVTSRYTTSSESQIESDLGLLKNAASADDFVEILSRQIDVSLTDDFWSIGLPQNILETSGARSPGVFAYYAALNILDARVLFSKMRVSELTDPALKAKKLALERHHLFPRAYLSTLGITSTSRRNQVANIALVEWPDNIAISDTPPVEYFPEFMERLTPTEREKARFWHALPKGWETMEYDAFLEERRAAMAKVIRAGFERLRDGEVESQPAPKSVPTEVLLESGESARVEFKAAARYNQHTKQADSRIEHAIAKTICGFLNADGGTLLIGVDDEGGVVGLEHDYQLLAKKSADGFELWLNDLVSTRLGKVAAVGITAQIEAIGDKDVCRVGIPAATKPVFLRTAGSHSAEFWLRLGNSTRQLQTDEVLEYQKDRFSDDD